MLYFYKGLIHTCWYFILLIVDSENFVLLHSIFWFSDLNKQKNGFNKFHIKQIKILMSGQYSLKVLILKLNLMK